jgi:DNA-binding FadR family transcriptional regulator
MSVSALTTNTLLDPSALAGSNPHRKDLQNLADALQSGDLAAAQKAFAQLLKDSPRLAQAVNETSTDSSNPRVVDFQTLAKALNSGDLASAQQTMVKLLQDAPRTGRHHSFASASGLLSTDDATVSGGSTAETSTVGTMINALA